MTRVLFLTTHLAGTGHFVRTLALARAARAAGAEVRVVSGGRPLAHLPEAGVEIVQIPPLSVRGLDFATMLTAEGAPADEASLAARQRAIEAAIREVRPDALVTETFPLGRRRLAAEFEAGIAAARTARPGAAVLASVRDIPEPPSRPERLAAAAARLRADYDAVLVHGEAGLVPLSASWALPDDLAPRIHHCGYVGAPLDPAGGTPSDEVLVSVGGGDRGRDLLALAARAAALSPRPWRLLVGGADAEAVAGDLAARHRARNLAIEPARPDYRALLARAACSVSLAGYNTVTDLAPLDTPALLVPDETAGEREQAIRARALARHPGIEVMATRAAGPERLAAAVERLSAARRPPLPLGLDGAARAARIILAVAREKGAA